MTRLRYVRAASLFAVAAAALVALAAPASAAPASAAPASAASARSTPAGASFIATPPKAASVAGFVQVRNVITNKCLDVSHNSTTRGAVVWQWTCGSGNNQLWSKNVVGNGFYQLQSRSSGLCLDLRIGSGIPPNGTATQLWDCNSSISSESWRLDLLDPFAGTYSLFNATGKCLDLNNGASADGTKVQVWDCADTDNQHWRFV
jgi:Ricin-type beta-trefoil lectin domain